MKLGARRGIRRTTALSMACGAVLMGIALPYYGLVIPLPLMWSGGCFLFAVLFRRMAYLSIAFIIIGCALLGTARGAMMLEQLQHYDALFGQEVMVWGRVADDIGVNEVRHQQEFHLADIQYQDRRLPGRLHVNTFDDIQLTRGDIVQVTGKVRASKGTTRQGTVRSAKVAIISKTDSVIEKFRTQFFTAVKTIMPEPQASLGLGYVVGLRVSLPEEVNEQLRVTGLTHIIAVSGYNLTILVQAARRLFAKRSAYQSVVFAGLLLFGFVVIAGGSASINRAAVVCVLSLVAWYYGRAFKPLLLLLLSGVITGLYNPLYVWGDPGWYLSFLAFAGILLLAPLIMQRYFLHNEPRLGVQILLETLCAQLFTLPYTMYLFGAVSLIAPLANILVLPLIPFIMIGVVISGLLGMLAPGLATMLAIVPGALLSLQLRVVERLSNLSWAHQEVAISLGAMVAMFAALMLYICLLQRKVKLEKNDKSEYNNTSQYL